MIVIKIYTHSGKNKRLLCFFSFAAIAVNTAEVVIIRECDYTKDTCSESLIVNDAS